MSIEKIERGIIKDGNLKPLCEVYGTFNSVGQRVLEEAIINYLNNFNMTLVEIMPQFHKGLHEILEMRIVSAKTEEEKLREPILVDLCSVMSIEEMKPILNKE